MYNATDVQRVYNISDVQRNGCTTGVQLKYNVNKYNTIILIRIKDFRHYRVFVLFFQKHSLSFYD